MKYVLVTGATGFVGRALVNRLGVDDLYSPVAIVRSQRFEFPSEIPTAFVSDLGPNTDWTFALNGIDFVVHAAARAHVLKETTSDPLGAFTQVNVHGTLTLAQQAARVGVKRFIFISSIGVNGKHSTRPFTEDDIPYPEEPYAVSKFEAEKGLNKLAIETGMEVVIIRPPLVYGPKAPGNFGRLMRVVNKGIPLPLGAINNKRSLVALDNLVDLIITCIDHPRAANQTFLAGDGEDLSTTDLLRRMAKSLSRSARLIPVPVKLLRIGAILFRKQSVVQRLCDTLQVDISKARDVLGWMPPVSVDEGMKRTADGFLGRD